MRTTAKERRECALPSEQSSTACGALQCSSRIKLESDLDCAEGRTEPKEARNLAGVNYFFRRQCQLSQVSYQLFWGYSLRLMLPFALAAIFVLGGVMFDVNYQRSTPDPIYVQGTVVGFARPHPKQVYPIFEFKDAGGRLHHVVNSSQQAIVRLATGDAVPIAYSQSDPQRARIVTFWFKHRWVMGGFIVALALVFGALMRRQSSSA